MAEGYYFIFWFFFAVVKSINLRFYNSICLGEHWNECQSCQKLFQLSQRMGNAIYVDSS